MTVIPEKFKHLIGKTYVVVQHECPKCNGEGKIKGGEVAEVLCGLVRCQDCFGSGFIQQKLTPEEFQQLQTLRAAVKHENKLKK
jgi:DnaJ-class molecular chaperone